MPANKNCIKKMVARAENQGFELDALEHIFRQEKQNLEKGILNFTTRNKDRDVALRTKEEEDRMKTEMQFTSNMIHVSVSLSDSSDEVDVCDVNISTKSPALLSAPLPSLAFVRSKYRPPVDEMFVSGVEAQRQQFDLKTFGMDIAHSLADRRATYNRKLRSRAEEEANFIANYVGMAKVLSIPLSNESSIEEQEKAVTERRSALWRRCAAMSEILAKEEAERLLWKKKFCIAAFAAYGNDSFY